MSSRKRSRWLHNINYRIKLSNAIINDVPILSEMKPTLINADWQVVIACSSVLDKKTYKCKSLFRKYFINNLSTIIENVMLFNGTFLAKRHCHTTLRWIISVFHKTITNHFCWTKPPAPVTAQNFGGAFSVETHTYVSQFTPKTNVVFEAMWSLSGFPTKALLWNSASKFHEHEDGFGQDAYSLLVYINTALWWHFCQHVVFYAI